jgi:Nif-specific regulatory protein
MRELLEAVNKVAPTDSTVLVLGESGTGKELVARAIHESSGRREGPCVAVNCAAFNESLLESELFGHERGAFTGADKRRLGQFETAHRGTIFLDEIGELSAACQAKLLRVLEGHPFQRVGGNDEVRVDVRIIAATHRELVELVRGGKFRQDLYYRLRVLELRIPPLRDRGDDRLLLAEHYLVEFRKRLGGPSRRLTKDAIEAVQRYDWPGNVRELRNAIERAMVLGTGPLITGSELQLGGKLPATRGGFGLVPLAEAERRHIREVLNAVGGNKSRACRILDISRATLYNKLGSQDG